MTDKNAKGVPAPKLMSLREFQREADSDSAADTARTTREPQPICADLPPASPVSVDLKGTLPGTPSPLELVEPPRGQASGCEVATLQRVEDAPPGAEQPLRLRFPVLQIAPRAVGRCFVGQRRNATPTMLLRGVGMLHPPQMVLVQVRSRAELLLLPAVVVPTRREGTRIRFCALRPRLREALEALA